ncbi:MAG: (5-formylfuran-3-yl)methyl phosphate synthase [Gemmataceae bacterium]|nr:(5-formylfuran-3-yl)methyl phosphate synthase [Gemmataceae bacterium]MCI0739198.1 (5-formylfuran-3-yl)methyl phosphate synthase [Gemmataceae bacterium]
MIATTVKTGLLVSVRSAQEAVAAHAGGADIIDVKEPSRGALGRADSAVIADVLRVIAGRSPVSAAMGEIVDSTLREGGGPSSSPSRDREGAENPRGHLAPPTVVSKLAYHKWGLANARDKPWRKLIQTEKKRLLATRLVVVAYADGELCNAPSLNDTLEFVCAEQSVLLVDTFKKDGRSLLHWLLLSRMCDLVQRCHDANVRVALAGSLGVAEIEKVMAAEPDWIGVRGAACAQGDRQAVIQESKVRQLAGLIHCWTAASRTDANREVGIAGESDV